MSGIHHETSFYKEQRMTLPQAFESEHSSKIELNLDRSLKLKTKKLFSASFVLPLPRLGIFNDFNFERKIIVAKNRNFSCKKIYSERNNVSKRILVHIQLFMKIKIKLFFIFKFIHISYKHNIFTLIVIYSFYTVIID